MGGVAPRKLECLKNREAIARPPQTAYEPSDVPSQAHILALRVLNMLTPIDFLVITLPSTLSDLHAPHHLMNALVG